MLTIEIPAISPLIAYVRGLPGSFYLKGEVADALDVAPNTLRRLAVRDPERLGPSREVFYGRIRVALYDQNTVDVLHAYLRAHRSRRGRPRLWDDQQRRARRNTHGAAGYYRRRAVVLQQSGDVVGTGLAHARCEDAQVRLRAQHDAVRRTLGQQAEGDVRCRGY